MKLRRIVSATAIASLCTVSIMLVSCAEKVTDPAPVNPLAKAVPFVVTKQTANSPIKLDGSVYILRNSESGDFVQWVLRGINTSQDTLQSISLTNIHFTGGGSSDLIPGSSSAQIVGTPCENQTLAVLVNNCLAPGDTGYFTGFSTGKDSLLYRSISAANADTLSYKTGNTKPLLNSIRAFKADSVTNLDERIIQITNTSGSTSKVQAGTSLFILTDAVGNPLWTLRVYLDIPANGILAAGQSGTLRSELNTYRGTPAGYKIKIHYTNP